jgi:hypothetical protein
MFGNRKFSMNRNTGVPRPARRFSTSEPSSSGMQFSLYFYLLFLRYLSSHGSPPVVALTACQVGGPGSGHYPCPAQNARLVPSGCVLHLGAWQQMMILSFLHG